MCVYCKKISKHGFVVAVEEVESIMIVEHICLDRPIRGKILAAVVSLSLSLTLFSDLHYRTHTHTRTHGGFLIVLV